MAASPCLLEPVMKLEIQVPEENLGDVMGDISGRRGHILGVNIKGRHQVVEALVPEMELYRYATTLRSITGGRGIHTESFDHYDNVPPELEAKIIAQSK